MKGKTVALVLIFAVLVAALGFVLYLAGNVYLERNQGPLVTEITTDQPQRSQRITKETHEEHETAPDDLVFLAMGIDTKESEDQLGVRTDTIILVRVSFENETVKLLSIPRDSRVIVRGRMDKINHAHSYGGIDLALETVNDFLGTDIKNYMRVDYQAVETVVDAIGGVELDIKQRMYYHDPTPQGGITIDFEPGLTLLDGEDAIRFLRFRSYPDGDVDRVKAQQYFLTEMMKQSMEKVDIGNIPEIIKSAILYTDTNISLGKLIQSAEIAKKFDHLEIETKTIPGTGQYIGDISYFIVDESGTEEIVNQWFNDYKK